MKIQEVIELTSATVHHMPNEGDVEVLQCQTSDLMSDVLRYPGTGMLLITGLMTPQVIRTSTIMDINAVIFTQGKKLTEEMIEAAIENEIAVLSTDMTNFSVSGKLFSAGLKSV